MQSRSFNYEIVKDIRLKIVTAQMPPGIHGMITEDNNNDYMIVLRADDSEAEQRHAFIHEALHLYEDDFQRANVQTVEGRTHHIIFD